MFDSLDEQMKMDDQKEISTREKVIRWTVVAITSVVLFGGIYYGIRFLE